MVTSVDPDLHLVSATVDLDLFGWNVGAQGDFFIEAVEGTEWGNPGSERRSLRTGLADGSVSVLDRKNNRSVPLVLRVEAESSGGLAEAEAALFGFEDVRSELRWTPPKSDAITSVLLAVGAELVHDPDDLAEHELERYYRLTLDALPHAYSLDYVTIPAIVAGASTPTLIDDCASLTGWAASGATLALAPGSGSATTITATAASDVTSFTVTRTGAVDLTSESYLSVAETIYSSSMSSVLAKVEVQGSDGVWTEAPIVAHELIATVADATDAPDLTITAIRFTYQKPAGVGMQVAIDKVSKQATARSTTSRQQVRTAAIPGSARTPSSILVESPTSSLGTTIVYTGPGYNPSLSRAATAARTPTAGAVSGSIKSVAATGSEFYQLSAADVPAGDYSLYAYIKPNTSAISGTIEMFAQMLSLTGAVMGDEVSLGVTDVSWVGTEYKLFLLGSETLPHMLLPEGSTAMLQLRLEWTPDEGTTTVSVDEVWAFNRTVGALGIVEGVTGRSVWFDAPTLLVDHPTVWVGTGDKTLARAANLDTELVAWPGLFRVQPPLTYIYSATFGAADAEVSATVRPAHLTHPTV